MSTGITSIEAAPRHREYPVMVKMVQDNHMSISPAEVSAIIDVARLLHENHNTMEAALRWSGITEQFYNEHIDEVKRLYPKYINAIKMIPAPVADIGVGTVAVEDEDEEGEEVDGEVDGEGDDEEIEPGSLKILLTVGPENMAELRRIKARSRRSISSIVMTFLDEGLLRYRSMENKRRRR